MNSLVILYAIKIKKEAEVQPKSYLFMRFHDAKSK